MRPRKTLLVEQELNQATQSAVFRLSGKLTGTKECYEFLEDAREAINAGHRHIVVNLEKITHVSSPGIGIIAACYTSAQNAKGSLAVVEVPTRVRTLLEIVCLWKLVGGHISEESALQAALN